MSDHGKAGIDRLKELEQRINMSKGTSSPTLKIPNGSGSGTGGFPGMFNNIFLNHESMNDPMKQFAAMNPALLAAAVEMDDSNNNNNQHSNSNGGGKMKEYQCSFCSFSTPYYAFLFIHERSHSIMNPAAAAAMNSAILRNVSPMLPTSGFLNDFGQFKEDLRGLSAQQPLFANQSESAVSIAKDLFPLGLGQPAPASITPTSTPASTPGVGMGMAELHVKNESEDEEKNHSQQPPRKKSRSNRNETVRSDNFLRKFPMAGDAIPMGKLSKLESSHMLKDMANLTKRPAIYALPKESEPMIMQSFLIEETTSNLRGNREKRKLTDIEDAENRHRQMPEDALALVVANNNSNNNMNSELKKTSGGSTEDLAEVKNRFVPAVVFLPVRERISTPVTISFTLTPA